MQNRIYYRIGRIIGKRGYKKVKKKLNYAGISIDTYSWIGFSTIFSVLFSIAMFLVLSLFMHLIISLSIGIVMGITVYFLLQIIVDLLIDVRKRFVESILPDVLSLISINLKGGLDTEEAFLAAVRPEFGFFSDELLKVSKQLHSGVDMKEALDSLNEHVESNVLKRITNLIIEGITSGGEIATMLEKSSEMLRKLNLMNEERKSSTTAYFWFIILASSIAAPLLFSSAYFLETMLFKLMPKTNVVGEKFIPHVIPPHFIFYFLITNLVIISLFGGILVGVVRRGKEKYGLKYSPILLSLSLIIFLAMIFILKTFFGKI